MDYMGASFYVFLEELFASIRELAINTRKAFPPNSSFEYQDIFCSCCCDH